MTRRQRAFAHEYLKLGNATKAAKNAGYSEKSAHVQGCQLLKNPKVADYLSSLQQAEAVAAGCTLEEHTNRLAALRDAAADCGNWAAAIQAEHHIGKAYGHYTDKARVEVENVTALAYRRREQAEALN